MVGRKGLLLARASDGSDGDARSSCTTSFAPAVAASLIPDAVPQRQDAKDRRRAEMDGEKIDYGVSGLL